jgi:MYND finger protein
MKRSKEKEERAKALMAILMSAPKLPLSDSKAKTTSEILCTFSVAEACKLPLQRPGHMISMFLNLCVSDLGLPRFGVRGEMETSCACTATPPSECTHTLDHALFATIAELKHDLPEGCSWLSCALLFTPEDKTFDAKAVPRLAWFHHASQTLVPLARNSHNKCRIHTCKNAPKSKCDGCKKPDVLYCGVECQVADWAAHSQRCKKE